ncbi:hypothetical protein GOP47_0004814 [Adiantum capillus-veneris]|uniref:Uncharacterized protein n=1 Tax=Adiantum capillus-veneris TaxID=13818 RepID=A0A9D4V3Z0_ADICA|nr:hypothetical protein GOP47_0004814 [Adiantum capillus-veneris]
MDEHHKLLHPLLGRKCQIGKGQGNSLGFQGPSPSGDTLIIELQEKEMERKSTWPWRKKLEKINTSQLLATATPTSSALLPADLNDPSMPPFDDCSSMHLQHPKLRQIHEDANNVHAVSHGCGSEETVEMLAKKIVDLSSRLAAKDDLASQQSRIAKDAVEDLIMKDEQLKQHAMALKEEKAAREKAEAGCLSLQQELDKACQQKGVVEARMMQLNGALKECMDEMRHAKDQLELKAQEATSRKREWDRLKYELDTENAQLKRQLMEATAENIAISKSLQERGRSLNEIFETRSKVESESKILQVQIESLHKDMDADKYEIHVLKKELQIRNDEKEQNRKLADATHKQHLESVKKIAKFESECNRLRALVRKKLPGPAAIAQMRVEGDHVGKKRMPNPKTYPDQRDIETLNGRLMSMEDETKLLKESLAKKTVELQVARQLCARTASKLSSAEGIIEAMAKGQPLPTLSSEENHATPCSTKCDPMQQQSLALSPAPLSSGGETIEVMDWALSSEDGNNNDDELSTAESWASALIAELSHLKQDDGNPTLKTDENGKPGIRVIGPLVQDFDLKSALQELNTKLLSIGESILVLLSSMKCVGDQGLSFGMLGQIMEEFAFVKQVLLQVQKAVESIDMNQLKVVQLDKSLQGSDKTNKIDGSMVIDECNEDMMPPEINSDEKGTSKGSVRKIMEALFASAERKLENVESGAEGVLVRQRKGEDALDDDLRNLSEVAAAELLCKIGDLVKEHCIASWALADDVQVGCQNLVEETGRGRGEIDMSTGEISFGQRETDDGLISGTDEYGGSLETGGHKDNVLCSSRKATDGHHSSSADVANEGLQLDVGEASTVVGRDIGVDSVNVVEYELHLGKNGVDSVIDNVGDVHVELPVQIELLQHEVERLSAERNDLAAKLVASQGQLEQQLARIATLDAESLLLANEKSSLAQHLSDATARNQGLEEDLAEARASLDDLRQQVSSLTSELADQAARCQELQGNVIALSDVGASSKGIAQAETDGADGNGKHRKEREIASAKVQLAECQRTILVLGSQLRALSSVQDHVAAEPSFDSSLESATSTDHLNLPPMALAEAYGGGHVAERSNRSVRGQPAAYVRTRGGRLVSAEQYWGSGREVPVAGHEKQGTASHPSYSSRHKALPRHVYGVACAQSPLHEYATEQPAYAYSPPETALSSPATSPARYNLQIVKAQPLSSANLLNATSTAAAATGAVGCSSPSAVRRGSRIARFFARAKKQR